MWIVGWLPAWWYTVQHRGAGMRGEDDKLPSSPGSSSTCPHTSFVLCISLVLRCIRRLSETHQKSCEERFFFLPVKNRELSKTVSSLLLFLSSSVGVLLWRSVMWSLGMRQPSSYYIIANLLRAVRWERWMSQESFGMTGLLNWFCVCFGVSSQVNHTLGIKEYWLVLYYCDQTHSQQIYLLCLPL